MRRWLIAACALNACGGESDPNDEPPPTEPSCLAPNRLVGDACIAPGVQDDGCPAGTLAQPDGRCLPAGVPEELCATGFVPDGGGGCTPVLPAARCGAGSIAVPGDRSCRPVKPCASGTWGDIAVDSTTEYVNASYSGADSDGSSAKPWLTIGEAVAAAADDAVIAIAEGNYVENVDVTGKSAKLRGVCPERVTIVGTIDNPLFATVSIYNGADGTEVSGITISGPESGIALSNVLDVVVDQVWIHETGNIGMEISNSLGPSSATVSNTLVERAKQAGVLMVDADARFEASVVRATQPRVADALAGRGFEIQAGLTQLERVVVEDNHEVGVNLTGAALVMASSVVRGTQVGGDEHYGFGVWARADASGVLASLEMHSSVVQQNHAVGVAVQGATAMIETSVVRDTQPRVADDQWGIGVAVQGDLPGTAATLRASLLDQNRDHGLFIMGASAVVEGTLVRRTLPQAVDNQFGVGIGAHPLDANGARSSLEARGSAVDESHGYGIVVMASDAEIQGQVVTRVLGTAADERGVGIVVQQDPKGARATASLAASLVEDVRQHGILVVGADLIGMGLIARETLVDPRGQFGDGVTVAIESAPASAVISFSKVEHNARAGLSTFGAPLSLSNNHVACNAFDVDAEIFMTDYVLDDGGGNLCGCPLPETPCKAISAQLAPPSTVQ